MDIMYLHEFQAKQLFSKYGVPVAPFSVISSLDDLEEAILANNLHEAVLKIQVHSGGRGKAGGIRFAKNRQEMQEHARALLGMRVVTTQTGPEGVVAEKVLLDTPIACDKEYYLAVCIDRLLGSACVIASSEGGMDIEEIAEKRPEKIMVEKIPDNRKLYRFQLLRLAKFLGWKVEEWEAGFQVIIGCVKAFFDSDAVLVEINPLASTSNGSFVALDAKIQIDDNALFRQKALESLWDPNQVSERERKAREHDLAYVSLDGSIGCIVNGAGLAMATMDLIRFWGGEPANFLDVGGGATEEKIVEGFSLLFSDEKVNAVLVNIFGGIMNCATIASALDRAVKKENYKKPIVVRMEGTNVDKAREMLTNSELNVIFAANLDEAARTVVKKGQEWLS